MAESLQQQPEPNVRRKGEEWARNQRNRLVKSAADKIEQLDKVFEDHMQWFRTHSTASALCESRGILDYRKRRRKDREEEEEAQSQKKGTANNNNNDDDDDDDDDNGEDDEVRLAQPSRQLSSSNSMDMSRFSSRYLSPRRQSSIIAPSSSRVIQSNHASPSKTPSSVKVSSRSDPVEMDKRKSNAQKGPSNNDSNTGKEELDGTEKDIPLRTSSSKEKTQKAADRKSSTDQNTRKPSKGDPEKPSGSNEVGVVTSNEQNGQPAAGELTEKNINATGTDKNTIVVVDSDSDSEHEMEFAVKDIPDWATSPELQKTLDSQKKLNPDKIFGKMPPLQISEVFGKLSRYS